MTPEAIQSIAGMMRVCGARPATVSAFVSMETDNGLVCMRQVREATGLSAKTVKRICAANGIRCEKVYGPKGSLVDLAALQAVERGV